MLIRINVIFEKMNAFKNIINYLFGMFMISLNKRVFDMNTQVCCILNSFQD